MFRPRLSKIALRDSNTGSLPSQPFFIVARAPDPCPGTISPLLRGTSMRRVFQGLPLESDANDFPAGGIEQQISRADEILMT
jgi:hypothetical protein